MTRAIHLATGTQLGAYQIQEPLGGGGMGMVYRAVHVLLHRPAAIKVLRPELSAYTVALDRFLNEARATTAIRHPGIVEVYDYGQTDAGCAYIAMELLDGVTLGARIGEYGTLPLQDALAIARRIAAPLAVAHERGVVHRDLKPDNVFLIRDHETGRMDAVKLLDFGIAKLENAAGCRTTAGLILGTPAYMSPEQCRGTGDCDHRADLYALGCILFEMLTGQPPFGRGTASGDLLAAHIAMPPPDVTRFVTVPSDIARLVARLLAKNPDDRPRSALEVVFEIDRYFATREPSQVPTARNGMRFAIAAAAGLAMSLAAIGAWYRWWRAPRMIEVARAESIAPTLDARLAIGTEAPPPDAAQIDATLDAAVTIEIDAAITRPVGRKAPPIDAGELMPMTGSARAADVNTTVAP
jgi:serine/threonine protein kinase